MRIRYVMFFSLLLLAAVCGSTVEAHLELTETRTGYSGPCQSDYIEFKVTQSGNLGGLIVFILPDGLNPIIYNFPAVDVTEGEYITLRLYTSGDEFIVELADSLSECTIASSCYRYTARLRRASSTRLAVPYTLL